MPEFQNVDPETLLTDPKAWQQGFETRVAQYVNAALGNAAVPVLQQLSDTLETQARNDPANADVVDKYWGDVTQLVAQVPPTQRSAALYREAVTLVRGKRFDELAAAKAAQLAAAGTGIEGVSGSGAPGGSDPQAEVWQRIEATELGKRQIATSGRDGFRRAVAAMGETLESYAEKLSKTATTFDTNKPGTWQTQLVKGGAR